MSELAKAYVQIIPSAREMTDGIEKELGGVGAQGGSAAGAKFLSFFKKAVPVAAIGKFMKDTITQGSGLEQNIGGTKAVFGEFASDIQNTAKAAYKNMGLSASAYMATANKMGSLFKGSGLESAKAIELTTKSMQRAADVASVMGISTESTMESIAGAAKGNFTMMDNLGVAMNATTLQAYALEKGMTDFKFAAATNAEKAELAMQMFFERTQNAADNFARESAETISGSFLAMKAAGQNVLGNLALGENVRPSLEALLSATKTFFINNFLPAVGNVLLGLGDIIADSLEIGLGKAGDFFEGLKGKAAEWFGKHRDLAVGLAAAIGALTAAIIAANAALIAQTVVFYAYSAAAYVVAAAEAIATAATAAWGAVTAFLASPITIIIGAIAALAFGIYMLIAHWDTVKAVAVSVWEAIKGAWQTAAEWFTANVVEPLKAAASAAWEGVKAAFAPAIGYFEQVWNTIKGIFAAVKAVLSGNFSEAWAAIQGIVSGWAGYFGGIWGQIKAVFSDAVNLGQRIVDDIKAGIANAWDSLVSWFKGIFSKLFGNLKVKVGVSGNAAGEGATPLARGLSYVPYDDFPAILHKGERVLTAQENAEYNRGGVSSAAVVELLEGILVAVSDKTPQEIKMIMDKREFGRAVMAVG